MPGGNLWHAGAGKPNLFFLLTFTFESIISLKPKVQFKFRLHIRTPCDEGFEMRPLWVCFEKF